MGPGCCLQAYGSATARARLQTTWRAYGAQFRVPRRWRPARCRPCASGRLHRRSFAAVPGPRSGGAPGPWSLAPASAWARQPRVRTQGLQLRRGWPAAGQRRGAPPRGATRRRCCSADATGPRPEARRALPRAIRPQRHRRGRGRSPRRRGAHAARLPGCRPAGQAAGRRPCCVPGPPAPSRSGGRGARPTHQHPAPWALSAPARGASKPAGAAYPGWSAWPAAGRGAHRLLRPQRGRYGVADRRAWQCALPGAVRSQAAARQRSGGHRPWLDSGNAAHGPATRRHGPAKASPANGAHRCCARAGIDGRSWGKPPLPLLTRQ